MVGENRRKKKNARSKETTPEKTVFEVLLISSPYPVYFPVKILILCVNYSSVYNRYGYYKKAGVSP
jgi:hypothetical protein